MKLDKYFQMYEGLLAEADQAFERAKRKYPEEIHCQKGCYDCCYINMFFICLIEGIYLYEKYGKSPSWLRRKIDRNLLTTWQDILASGILTGEYSSEEWRQNVKNVAKLKILCPLVVDGSCALYQYRPVICRLYGAPLITEEGGIYLSCDKDSFVVGKEYETIVYSHYRKQVFEINNQMMKELAGFESESADSLLVIDLVMRSELLKQIEMRLSHGILQAKCGQDEEKGRCQGINRGASG